MSVRGLDYGALLREAKPQVIHGEEQNRLFLETLERLAGKRKVTAAERKLIELLTVLIEDFESKAYVLKDAEPVEVIRHLMEENKLRQKDLLDIFGTESI